MRNLIFACVALLGLTSFSVADGGGPTFAPSFRSRSVIRQRAPLFQRSLSVSVQRNVYAQPKAAFIPVPVAVPQYVPVPVAVPQYVPVPVAVPTPTYVPAPRQRAPYCP